METLEGRHGAAPARLADLDARQTVDRALPVGQASPVEAAAVGAEEVPSAVVDAADERLVQRLPAVPEAATTEAPGLGAPSAPVATAKRAVAPAVAVGGLPTQPRAAEVVPADGAPILEDGPSDGRHVPTVVAVGPLPQEVDAPKPSPGLHTTTPIATIAGLKPVGGVPPGPALAVVVHSLSQSVIHL